MSSAAIGFYETCDIINWVHTGLGSSKFRGVEVAKVRIEVADDEHKTFGPSSHVI